MPLKCYSRRSVAPFEFFLFHHAWRLRSALSSIRTSRMATPLQPKDFFRGRWYGEGELVPHPMLRLFIRRQRITLSSEARWLTETIWLVKDRMEFASGWVYNRKMFAELVAPERIHVTQTTCPWARISSFTPEANRVAGRIDLPAPI